MRSDVNALVFVDVTDAWSYIGAVRFERAAALFTILTGRAVNISYRASDGQAQTDPQDVDRAAMITGIDLNLEEMVAADSSDAWRLLTWAAASGPDVQRDLLHQLWRAHFLEGADVGDPLVLSGRAALVGLDLELADEVLAGGEFVGEVIQQREMAGALGAEATPFIVIDSHHTQVGS